MSPAIVCARMRGSAEAREALEEFERRFRGGELPEDMRECTVRGPLPLANLLKEADLTRSTSEAHRMARQGAIRVDGEKVESADRQVEVGSIHVYQVGKRRFARVTVA